VVLTGSAALGIWTTPRQSRDIDLCASVPAEAVPKLLARFDGIAAGPSDDPGALRLNFAGWDIDVFVVGDDPYYDDCARRAVHIDTPFGPIAVATAEDLLIHKLIKLRTDRRRFLQDLADMRALLETGGQRLQWEHLQRWLPPAEADFLRRLRDLSDEEIAQGKLPRLG